MSRPKFSACPIACMLDPVHLLEEFDRVPLAVQLSKNINFELQSKWQSLQSVLRDPKSDDCREVVKAVVGLIEAATQLGVEYVRRARRSEQRS